MTRLWDEVEAPVLALARVDVRATAWYLHPDELKRYFVYPSVFQRPREGGVAA